MIHDTCKNDRRDEVFRLLMPVWERWAPTAAALRRALPELGRGELALLCAYLGAGFAVRAGLQRETWLAVCRLAFDHVAGVLPDLVSRHPNQDGSADPLDGRAKT